MKHSAPRLTRRQLEHLPLEMAHEARNWTKADVLVAEWPPQSGQRVIIKDLKKRSLWFRLLAGRLFLRREWHALRFLNGMSGVPRAIARPDADAIVIEYLQGTPAVDIKRGALSSEVLQRVSDLVNVLHAHGVTHGDLHQENILVGDDGSVAFIDWATANVFSKRAREPRPRGVKGWTFDEWRALDLRAVAKLKAFHAPQTLAEDERDILERGGSRLYHTVKKARLAGERLRGKEKYEKMRRQGRFSSNAKFAKKLAKIEQGELNGSQSPTADLSRK
jgi:tRNA A-37 threonylcarbamoyl transferase component Bud32